MKKYFFTVFALGALIATQVFASTNTQFKYQSTVEIPQSFSKLYRIPFTDSMYEHINSTQDIRIFKSDGTEVPFFIRTDTQIPTTKINKRILPVIQTVNNTHSTSYILDVHNNPVSSFFVESNSQQFRKVVDVYGSHLSDSRFCI